MSDGSILKGARVRLTPIVRALVSAGISANTVTMTCGVLAALAGALVALGDFGVAALLMAIASVGDAVDGDLARAQGTASARGAILDATVDRYEEFFFLAGLAFFFRTAPVALALVLLAIIGSFMVSYGSAKAESYGLPIPAGGMRRTERAACLVLGTAFVPATQVLADGADVPSWVRYTPVILAVGLIGTVGNVSAVLRLRGVARAASRQD